MSGEDPQDEVETCCYRSYDDDLICGDSWEESRLVVVLEHSKRVRVAHADKEDSRRGDDGYPRVETSLAVGRWCDLNIRDADT